MKVKDVVNRTLDVKRKRVETDEEFKRFMQSKKDNHHNNIREEEIKTLHDGVEVF